MGGKGSGRLPLEVEAIKHKVIAMSWNKLHYKLAQKGNDKTTYVIANNIASKDMTSKVESKSDVTINDNAKSILAEYLDYNSNRCKAILDNSLDNSST